MRRGVFVVLVMAASVAACNNDEIVVVDDTFPPAAPQALTASYYAGAVTVEWELASGWDGETFRVYSRRITDADYFLIADVTSCSDGLCSYVDWNVVAGETYEYYVSAIDASGAETATGSSVQVFVPTPTPPPAPTATRVIGLDGAAYFTWGADSRSAADFSHYRVYQDAGGTSYLLGETDSEGFLDLLAANGTTYSYFVTALDTDGHESTGSSAASGTPRPDFTAEFMYDYFAVPGQSGFRFQADESTVAVGDGSTGGDWDFRLETDVNGWWLVPNTGTEVYDAGFTTALKCGVGADEGCLDVSVAPSSGYTATDVPLAVESSYVLRITLGGVTNYGVIRVTHLGYDQNADPIMIFDWAYQLQAGNPNLAPQRGT